MANRFLSNLRINDAYTFPDNDGSVGQAMVTDGAGNLTFGTVATGTADSALKITLTVKNVSGGTLSAGTLVRVATTANPPSGNVLEVDVADNSSSSTMPAVGILIAPILDEAEGDAVAFGRANGFSTSGYTEGDPIWVGSNGAFVGTKPTGSDLIQKVGQIIKVHPSNGSIEVFGAGRTNDVPNLSVGKIWVGTTTNTAESTVVHLDELNGRVGIGTGSSPSANLDVVGTAKIGPNRQAIFSESNGNNSSFIFSSSGNMEFRGTETDYNQLFLKSGGKVGIGTTSPSTKLTITESGTSTGSTLSLIGTNTGGSASQVSQISSYQPSGGGAQDAALDFKVRANVDPFASPSTIMTLLGSGNVGIGTTSPSNDVSGLHIAVASSTDQLYLERTGSATGKWWLGTANNSLYFFDTVANDFRMIINSSGNVGIGTTSPTNKLTVSQNYAYETSTTVHNNAHIKLQEDTASTYITNINGITYLSTAPQKGADRGALIDGNTKSATIKISGRSVGTIQFKTGSGTTGTIISENTRMIISNDGNVGIGTTSPTAAKLDVAGAVNVTGGTIISGVDVNANVGVAINRGKGLYSNDGSYLRKIIEHTSGNDIAIGQGGTSLIGNITFQPGSSGDIKFYPSGGQDVTFASSGNVGIGTTSPNAKLHVYNSSGGDATSKASMLSEAVLKLQPHATNSTNLLFAQVNGGNGIGLQVTNGSATANWDLALSPFGGNVGIGTTSPQSQTHIYTAGTAGNNYYEGDLQVGGVSSLVGAKLNYASQNSGRVSLVNLNNSGGSASTIDLGFGAISTDGRPTNKAVTITQGGNVGIGTVSPSSKLHIIGNASIGTTGAASSSGLLVGGKGAFGNYVGSGDFGAAYNISLAAGITAKGINMGYNATADAGFIGVVHNGTGWKNLLLQPIAGNVGIGATSASTKLEVSSTAPSGDRTLPHNVLTLTAESSGLPYNGFGGAINFKNRSYTYGILNSARIRSVIDSDSGSNRGAGLAFDVTNSSQVYNTSLFLKYDGNVGIGATSPNAKLKIEGSGFTNGLSIKSAGNSGTYPFMVTYASGTEGDAFCIDDNLNVGIGTTTPSTELHVKAQSGYAELRLQGASGSGSTVEFYNDATKLGDIYIDPSKNIVFRNASERMRITSGGSVTANVDMRAPIFYDSNDTGYYLNPASTSNLNAVKANSLYLDRQEAASRGISWYSASYNAWSEYMSPSGTSGCGPTANITAPSGAIVTSWAQRTFIENAGNYGWTWESGTFTGQPSVVAEIRSSDGLAQFNGGVRAPIFYDSNDTNYFLDPAGNVSPIKGIDRGLSKVSGWVPAYGGADEINVSWSQSEDAVKLQSSTDSTSGMAFKARRIEAGQTVRFSLTLKANVSASSGVYIRLYVYNGDLPDGKTHTSVNASSSSPFVQEASAGVTNWRENVGINTSWTTEYYSYTATADCYVSMVVLNWTGLGTNAIYVKNPDIQIIDIKQSRYYDLDNTGYYLDPSSVSNLNQAKFYAGISVNSAASSTSKHGISLYNTQTAGMPAYGLAFTGTAGEGTHGSVTSDWATYFTMTGSTSRGWIFKDMTGGVGVASISSAGTAHFNGDVVASCSSDERLKDNKKNIENALEKVESLNGVEFDWNDKQDIYEGHDIGVIAQEVEKIAPEIVNTRDNGYKAVKYEKLVPLLIEAIKELSNEIKELKNK